MSLISSSLIRYARRAEDGTVGTTGTFLEDHRDARAQLRLPSMSLQPTDLRPPNSGGAVSTFRYFAYGSNMLTERLRARCPGARPVGVGVAAGYAVEFQKRGTDDSAKAALLAASDHQAYGVVFEIPESQRSHLDAAEASGYRPVTDIAVSLLSADLEGSRAELSTTTYVVVAGWHATNLDPFHWYKALVVHGAVEHGLPVEHIARLRSVPSIADPWPDRPGLLAARIALGASGAAVDSGSL